MYERVEGIPARRFAFDTSLFEINTPFVRSCFNKDNAVHEVNCLDSPLRKRRKTPENGPVNVDIKDVSKNIYVLVGKTVPFAALFIISIRKTPFFFFFGMYTYLVQLL
jgi:hypothetical protein